MMKLPLQYCLLLVLFIATPGQALTKEKEADTIVVIVHKDNPLTNVSAALLQKIYLGKVTIFPNGERIVLGEMATWSEAFYRILLNKTPMTIRKYWIGVVFSGGVATPPVELKKSEEIKEFIENNPGAIIFSTTSMVDSTMKILTIDGKNPGEPGYLLNLPTDQE